MHLVRRFFLSLLVLSSVASLVSCRIIREEKTYSGTLTEPAKVVDVIYTPERHGSGSGMGLDMDLNPTFHTTTVTIPRKYAIVFQCQHGKFIIENDQEKSKELWGRLKEGQDVTVYFREVYTERFQGDSLLSRMLIDLDFLDAK